MIEASAGVDLPALMRQVIIGLKKDLLLLVDLIYAIARKSGRSSIMANWLTAEEALELTKKATKDVAHSVWCTYYKNFTPEELVDKLVSYKGSEYWVSVWKYTNKAELRTAGKCYLGFVQAKVIPSPIDEHWEEYKNPQKFEWDLELFQEG